MNPQQLEVSEVSAGACIGINSCYRCHVVITRTGCLRTRTWTRPVRWSPRIVKDMDVYPGQR